MLVRISSIVSLGLVLAVSAPSASSQTDELNSLRRDIDAVRDTLKLIQNDVDLIKKLLQQQAAAAAPQPPAFQEAKLNLEGAPFLGDSNAKVTLVEFSDYQCPFCTRSFQQTFPKLMSEYVRTGKVKYVFRDFPLEQIHPFALKAAEAARCAGEQDKYWEMHDILFNNQGKLGPGDLAGHAMTAGLNQQKFQQCLDNGKQAEQVRKDQAEGQQAGVNGTPGFFLGVTQPGAGAVRVTKMIGGAQPYTIFQSAIEELLREAN